MIYAGIRVATTSIDHVVVFLHFLSVFFVNFGLIFIVIVNMIILESSIIFSVKRQNRFIILYGIFLFFGMLILIYPFEFVTVHASGYTQWDPIFFIYLVLIITGLAMIPIFYTSFKIYSSFTTKELKKKWFYYLIGSLGLAIFNLYPVDILNLLTHSFPENEGFLNISRSLISVLGISVIFWVSLMYYGIGSKLKP
ncbi:MAG: hypothetical protein KGD58_03420 [Candidatus Lokiarchaeota archaeon]|nr:hypothetical protein [Candidatus Lokiarchaeota archaeon]